MKSKNTLFLLVAAAVVLGAVYFIKRSENESYTSAAIPEQTLPSVTSGTVERIIVTAPGEKPVTLTRSADKWYTNVEKKYEADPGALTAVLSALDKPISSKVVSSSKDAFADFEVSETSGTQVKVFETGKKEPTLDLVLGKDGPTAYSTYVRQQGKDDVLNAQAGLNMAFRRPDGWRNKQVFAFNGSNATRVEASGTTATFALSRQGEKWLMDSPEKAEGEVARINSLANMLANLRANKFIEPAAGQSMADFGLEPSSQTVTLEYEDKVSSPSKTKSVTLLIGKESDTPGDFYAKRKDKDDVFTIGQYVMTSLLPAASELQVAKPEPPPPAEAATTATETATTSTAADIFNPPPASETTTSTP